MELTKLHNYAKQLPFDQSEAIVGIIDLKIEDGLNRVLAKMDAMNDKLTADIKAMDDRFNVRMDAMDEKFDIRMNAMDAKFRAERKALDIKFTTEMNTIKWVLLFLSGIALKFIFLPNLH